MKEKQNSILASKPGVWWCGAGALWMEFEDLKEPQLCQCLWENWQWHQGTWKYGYGTPVRLLGHRSKFKNYRQYLRNREWMSSNMKRSWVGTWKIPAKRHEKHCQVGQRTQFLNIQTLTVSPSFMFLYFPMSLCTPNPCTSIWWAPDFINVPCLASDWCKNVTNTLVISSWVGSRKLCV